MACMGKQIRVGVALLATVSQFAGVLVTLTQEWSSATPGPTEGLPTPLRIEDVLQSRPPQPKAAVMDAPKTEGCAVGIFVFIKDFGGNL